MAAGFKTDMVKKDKKQKKKKTTQKKKMKFSDKEGGNGGWWQSMGVTTAVLVNAASALGSITHEALPSGSLSRAREVHNGLLHVAAPFILIALTASLFSVSTLDLSPALGFVEFFSGKGMVSRAQMEAGKPTVSYEVMQGGRRCANMDIMSSIGFAWALCCILRLDVDSFCCGILSAPVCSTWVWVSQGSTGRRPYRPLGWAHLPIIREANRMVVRVLTLMYLCQALGIFWLLEQPASSVMSQHPHFQHFISQQPVFQVLIHMSNFGGATRKATLLYSSHKWVSEINDYQTTPGHTPHEKNDMMVTWTDAKGRKKCAGGPGLKASQAYPYGFGQAVQRLMAAHQEELRAEGHAARMRNRRTQPNMQDYMARAHTANLNEWWAVGGNLQSVMTFLKP